MGTCRDFSRWGLSWALGEGSTAIFWLSREINPNFVSPQWSKWKNFAARGLMAPCLRLWTLAISSNDWTGTTSQVKLVDSYTKVHLRVYTTKVHISIWNLLKSLRLNWLQNFLSIFNSVVFIEMDAEINALQIRNKIYLIIIINT